MKKFISLALIFTTLTTVMCNVNVQAAVDKPVSFLQDDSKWGSELYSITNNQSQTLASSGCAPTSMAMVLNYYIDESITPIETSEFALENNHRTKHNGTAWTYFEDIAEKYNLDFLQTASSAEALDWMNTQTDALIICSMGPGLWTKSGHFILLWNIENDIAYINDPASTKKTRIENSYKYLTSQCKQYFCFNKDQSLSSQEEFINTIILLEKNVCFKSFNDFINLPKIEENKKSKMRLI